ncbi:phospholipase A2 [Nocardia sp. NPDC051570]|uniref:phospholipase A2 n=1 Tax=Nocardia sp. NPDC051570 TaxID=3364324 RepID=UPI003795E9DD
MSEVPPQPGNHARPPRRSHAEYPSGTTERAVLRRLAAAAAVIGLVGASTMAFVPAAAAASVDTPAVENPDAQRAVVELAGVQPWSAVVPADFAASAGYRPTVSRGLLVDPAGACSSPIPLPAEFDTACQAHDLGYDLLRYAKQHGQPLGSWARQSIDASFEQQMHSVCAVRADGFSRMECDTMATVASTAVDLNSRRQNYATPMPEYLFGTQLSGKALGWQLLRVFAPAVLVLLALAALVVIRRRARIESLRSPK